MTLLPSNQPTIDAIYARYEASNDHEVRREYLGGSRLGIECRRALWLEFRWALRHRFPGRIMRIFQTGHREEERMIEDLRSVGVEVVGEQHEVKFCDGHCKGHFDGMCRGLIEAPATWHLLEIKTSNGKGYRELERKGVKAAKPIHYAQMQIYMGEENVSRGAYLVHNKDTDELYLERIHFDKAEYNKLLLKAKAIVFGSCPDPISNNPSFYQCRFCDYESVCRCDAPVDKNCRTCKHASPIEDGGWACERDGQIPLTCDEWEGVAL